MPATKEKPKTGKTKPMKKAVEESAAQEPVAKDPPTIPDDGKFAILGCGPAGLIAAWTLCREGVEKENISILSQAPLRPSPISGAQFLHQPVGLPGDTPPDGIIDFAKIGDAVVYAEKIYGDAAEHTSWDHIDDRVEAWSLDKVYESLWSLFEKNMVVAEINPENMRALIDTGEYVHIFSSIPPQAYCQEDPADHVHQFPKVDIVIGVPLWDDMPIDNLVVYSGRYEDKFYRVSKIFGKTYAEWPGEYGGDRMVPRYVPEPVDIQFGFKPLGTECDCFIEDEKTPVTRIGRFGTWDRRLLLHHVPEQVRQAL